MEVTKDNFEDALEEVLKEISTCSFAATDLEISGLWRNGEPGMLSSQEEYYNLFVDSASDFLCLQLGLTFFNFNSENKRYKAKTYCFYIFPRQLCKNSNDAFSYQTGSINFLVTHNFDFNKVFYEGISYLNIEKEARLSAMLEERRFYKEKNACKDMETIDIPEEHKKCVEETCDKLSSVLQRKEDTEVKVPGLNAYIRRLIYQTIKQRYPNGELLVDTREGAMISRKGKVEGHEPKSQLQIDQQSIEKAVGFSKVIKALSKSGKMIVGHNMFLDICHIVNHFLCDVPESYSDFKGLMKGVFPLLLDTKFMASSEGLRDLISNSTLNRLFSRMSESPFSIPHLDAVEGYSYSEKEEKFHNAGFDSYVTGVCFIAMYNYVASSRNSTGNVEFDPNSKKLKKYINRVYMNNSPDNHFHFGGEDPEPDRSHMFHVSIPKDWITKSIINVFSPYSRINVLWIDKESAWVRLLDKSQAEVASAGLCSKNPRQTGGAVITQYTSAKNHSVASSKKRTNEHSQHSSLAKRRKSSHEFNTKNRCLIETIPEEKSEEEWSSLKGINIGHLVNASELGRKEMVNYLTLENSSRRQDGCTKLLAVSSTGSPTPPSTLVSHGRGESLIKSSPQTQVIEELEKDVHSDRGNQLFTSNSNWDIS